MKKNTLLAHFVKKWTMTCAAAFFATSACASSSALRDGRLVMAAQQAPLLEIMVRE